MKSINIGIEETLIRNDLKPRPDASTAFWVSFLLPFSILISLFKNPQILSPTYKLATIASAGIIISNIILITQCVKYKNFKIGIAHYSSTIFTTFLFYTCLHKGYLFSIYSGVFSTILYYKCLPWLLKTFPKSFTFGEASLSSQGLIFFCYTASINILNSFVNSPSKVLQISTTILQIGILGFGIIAYFTYKIKYFRQEVPFYSLTIFVYIFCIIIPLHILLDRSPVLWIIQLLTDRSRTIHVILFWVVCTTLATLVINNQIQKGRKANTKIRKAFHILIFVVYLTGLIDQCSVLYLASGIVLVLFFALEIVRALNLPPFGRYLQDGFVVFADEKDAGFIACTPIYLLVGCSIPLWIHPDSCDVTDSAGFNLLPMISGILSIGIGDTLASIVGSWIGKHKWPKSNKTIEGTIACILSQIGLVFLLIHSGYVSNNNSNIVKASSAIVISSLVEALTDQIDNVILPLIMYILLF